LSASNSRNNLAAIHQHERRAANKERSERIKPCNYHKLRPSACIGNSHEHYTCNELASGASDKKQRSSRQRESRSLGRFD
jgi:aromatic ring-opening dioxygenase catalytic subunit (LigB family)